LQAHTLNELSTDTLGRAITQCTRRPMYPHKLLGGAVDTFYTTQAITNAKTASKHCRRYCTYV